MTLPPWEPLGRALEAYLEGDLDAAAEVRLEGGRKSSMVAAELFRADGFPAAELAALDLAAGRVLDLGAGAGSHALELEELGLSVVALDISPRAVGVMHRRGVSDARVGTIEDVEGASFDTVLMMMNGAGLAGNLAGLAALLARAHLVLAEGGALLIDSCDLRRTDDELELELIAARRSAGEYFGEVIFQMAYNGEVGEAFPWLFVDAATLRHQARRAGWHTQVVFEDPDGAFLARLTPAL